MKHKILKFFFILALLSGVNSFNASAQMTDEAIVAYITQGIAAGKTQAQIGNELLAKGVTASQAKRLLQAYKNRSQSGDIVEMGTKSLDSSRSIRSVSDAAETGNGIDDENKVGPASKTKSSDKKKKTRGLNDTEKTETGKADGLEGDEEEEELEIFGHDMFDNKNLTFEPNLYAATPESYVLGAGDEVIIDVWGVNEATIKQTIAPEGNIYVSQVGPIQLAGLNLNQATAKIRKSLSSKYSLAGSDPASQLSVTIGKIRTIQVNILGEVAVPGTYRLSSLTTVLNALYKAGGVSEIGSLRNIQISRGGKIIRNADIYRLIFEGTNEGDIHLQDGDNIIVPAYSAIIKAEGGVKRPMLYEIIPGESLSDVLRYTGGFVSNAFLNEVTVQRIDGSNGKVFTIQKPEFDSFAMQDGDILYVFTNMQKDIYANRIQIKGAVVRPGVFELGGDIMTVGQLVKHAGGLLDDAYSSRAQIIREKADRTLTLVAVPIGAIIKGQAEDIMLQKNDVLIVSDNREIDKKGDLSITGYVKNPGDYQFADGMTIEDLILLAGGLEDGASSIKVDVARRLVNTESTESSDTLAKIFSFGINDSLKVDKFPAFILEPFDVVSVRKSPTYVEQRRVRISGETTFPGEYTLVANEERISDLYNRAGGATRNAYIGGAMLRRKVTEDERNVRRNMVTLVKRGGNKSDSTFLEKLKINETYTIGIDLAEAIANPGGENDLILHDADELIIPSSTNTVRIQGEVMYPNSVNYIPGKPVNYYVHQAGGFSNEAKRSKVYVVYMNGKVSVGRGSKIKAGCEIVVPSRPERQKTTVGEWIGIGSAAASITTMIATIVSLMKR